MRQTIFILFMCLLVGCAIPPGQLTPLQKQQNYQESQEDLSFLNQWQMSGRFTIHHAHGADTANIEWIQYYDDFGIKISGPMNIGAAYIIGNKESITYKDGKGHEDMAATPEALLQAYTGYMLPISNLRYWLIGMPGPSITQKLTLSEQGFPLHFEQDGWTVDLGYLRPVGEYVLPRKITMKQRDFSITLQIYEWGLKSIHPIEKSKITKPSSPILMNDPVPFDTITPENSSLGKHTPPPSDPASSNSVLGTSFPPKAAQPAAQSKPAQNAPKPKTVSQATTPPNTNPNKAARAQKPPRTEISSTDLIYENNMMP